MHLAKKAIRSKFAWRTSPRKRPPPSNRSSQIPDKEKRLEDLFTNEEHEDAIQNLSLSTASYANTSGSRFVSIVDDVNVVSNVHDADEL